MHTDYIALSIPVFFFLIGIELLFDIKKRRELYRLNDSITNISLGIGQQVTGIFVKTAVMAGYFFLYDHFRFTTIPSTVLNWLLLFTGVDFFYYWFHRASHEVNFLWAAHIVHHQSEDYNLSVALRQSWLQGLFSWVFYLPLALAGFDPIMFLTISSFNTLYQFWIHTQMIKTMGPLEWVLNTPSHHRVHHGSNAKYIDKNHAGTLIIWDRLFGTFQKEEEEVVYGITKPLKSWNPVWANVHYWSELYSISIKTNSWVDKIKVFLKSPGWHPTALGGYEHPPEVDIRRYCKYDIKNSKSNIWYVLFQFVFALLLAVLMLFKGSAIDTWQLLLVGLYIIFTLVNCGGIIEKRVWNYQSEMVRVSAGLLLPIAFIVSDYFEGFFLWSVLYVPVSGLWFHEINKKKKIKIRTEIPNE